MKNKILLFTSAIILIISCKKDSFIHTDSIKGIQDEEVVTYSSKHIDNEYIVILKQENLKLNLDAKKSFTQYKINDILKATLINKEDIRTTYFNAIQGFSVKLTIDQVKEIKLRDDVLLVEQDQMISAGRPGKGGGGNGGGGTPPPQEVSYGTIRTNGGTYSGSKKAWIIDSGIDLDHPDLNVDISNAFTSWSSGPNSGYDDGYGHGTHVAGIVGAIDNSIGTKGVASGVTVVPVKVLSRYGSGKTSDIIAGIDHVSQYANVGDVANISIQGLFSSAMNIAVINAAAGGILFTIAAGNNSEDANNCSPASANGLNVYTVSAIDQSDVYASFSNYGNPPIDYAEPGKSIFSTYKDGGYTTMSGTSMAAPHLAGILIHGAIQVDGNAIGDPDGNADAIGVR